MSASRIKQPHNTTVTQNAIKMANIFIYLLITVVVHPKPIDLYFLNDDLETNLPERFGDPIDENWQDKRSVSNEFRSVATKHDNFPIHREAADFDYRNGYADEVDDGFEKAENWQKRESEREGNDDPLNEEDIRQILPKLSHSQHEALDSLMNDDGPNIDVDKRQLLKQNFENSFHLHKRHNFKVPCTGMRCEEYDQVPVSRESLAEEDGYNHCPGTHVSN